MSDRPSSPIPNLRDLSMEELRELSGHQHHLYGLGHIRDFLQEPASDSLLFRDLTVRKSSTPQNSQGVERPVRRTRYRSAFTVEYAEVQPSPQLDHAIKEVQQEHLSSLLARESQLIPPPSMSLSDLWGAVDLTQEIEQPAMPKSLTCGFPMMVTAPGSYYMFELGGGRHACISEEEIRKLERNIKRRERLEKRLALRQMKLHPRASRRSQIRKGRV